MYHTPDTRHNSSNAYTSHSRHSRRHQQHRVTDVQTGSRQTQRHTIACSAYQTHTPYTIKYRQFTIEISEIRDVGNQIK